MDAADTLAESTVTVSAGTYAVVKTDQPDHDAFATISDGREITVVADSDAYDDDHAIEVEDGWRRLTFDVVLPFELVGFLARVATALADADVSIFALSAYSTDHVFVKDADMERARATLTALGCTVDENHRP